MGTDHFQDSLSILSYAGIRDEESLCRRWWTRPRFGLGLGSDDAQLLLLSNTILTGSSAIRIIHTNPLMGVPYIYICFAVIVDYIGMFQFAYQVEEKFEDLKRMLEIKSMFLVNPVERKYYTRVLKSIPRMGIHVGGFYRVEREAVPVYIDFSVKQIVSLLLAFK